MSPDARQILNWRYGMCPIDADPDRFGPFSELVRIWHERKPSEDELPGRADFDFYDFRNWLGRVFIAKVERDPFDIRFALWGTMLTDWWGVDYTNKTLGEESSNPELWDIVELEYFKAMDSAPFLGIASGYLDQHRRSHVKVMSLDLPLASNGRLTHVLAAHIEISQETEPETLMPDCPISEYF